MNKGRGANLTEVANRSGTGPTITRPIATMGEVFADGSAIELIGGDKHEEPRLMLWNGTSEIVGPRVEHSGQLYEPAPINSSILHELVLPPRCRPHGTTHELLAEISELVTRFAGLSEKPASLVGRFVLCSWLVEAIRVAPALVLVGPDKMRGKRLVALLHCLCRHGLRLTGLTPASLRSLPGRTRFTYLISQPTISNSLEKLLHDASHRDEKIPYRGGLLDLFGAQVMHVESAPIGEPSLLRSIQIPMIPGGAELAPFDPEVQHQVTIEFQAKLLGFRRANLILACKLHFDSSKFMFPIRELAHSVAAATPDDVGLRAEVFELLREADEEIRAGKWIDQGSVAVEAILVACHESPGGFVYVGELAEIAQEIMSRRGVDSFVDPGAFGKCLKLLGLRAAPRDAKGIKIRLTEDVCCRARQLARDFGAPREEDAALQGQPAKGT
jgi:hypothetical protein